TLALESAWRFFPSGSIHLAVVDPGVGTERRALALMAGGHFFVGPDNGVFTFALTHEWQAVSVEAPVYRFPGVRRTFDGRDVFAPAGAHRACGVPMSRLGPPVGDPIRIALPSCRRAGDQIVGEVIGSDRFGNLLTSVTGESVGRLGASDAVRVELAGRDLGPLAASYQAAPPGVPTAIMGSAGRLEVFVRNASARTLLDVGRGTEVRVRKTQS